MGIIENKLANFKLQRVFNLTLILFLVVLSIISFDSIRSKVKDTKRKADLKQLQTALSIYYSQNNSFPEVQDDDFRGWDATFEPKNDKPEFLKILTQKNIIDRTPKDPINSNIYFYRYKKFPANSFGCQQPFYILQLMNFEQTKKDHGVGLCPQRNFVDEAPNGYTIQSFE